MAVTILDRPSYGQELASNLGAGLQDLLTYKMDQMNQQRQREVERQKLTQQGSALNSLYGLKLTPEQQYAIASNPALYQAALKEGAGAPRRQQQQQEMSAVLQGLFQQPQVELPNFNWQNQAPIEQPGGAVSGVPEIPQPPALMAPQRQAPMGAPAERAPSDVASALKRADAANRLAAEYANSNPAFSRVLSSIGEQSQKEANRLRDVEAKKQEVQRQEHQAEMKPIKQLNADIYTDSIKKSRIAPQTTANYNRLINAAATGKIKAGKDVALLDYLKMRQYFQNPTEDVADKLVADLALDINRVGDRSKRPTVLLTQLMQQSLPSRLNTPQGIVANSTIRKYSGSEFDAEEGRVAREIKAKNNNKLPDDFEEQLSERMAKWWDEKSQIITFMMENIDNIVIDKDKKLPDPSKWPIGAEVEDQYGNILIPMGDFWIKRYKGAQ